MIALEWGGKKKKQEENGGASASRQKLKKQTRDQMSEENLNTGSEWDTLFCSVNNSC